jgi:acetylornithine deacetylase/succinyl-diaminopimelate desuccinylase-like protein
MYGGAAPNPIQAIAEILCALKDRDGHIRIPGFYDGVRPPSETEIDAWKRLPFDPEQFRASEMKVPAVTGEPEVSILERIWARPTLEVHGIRGGFTGEGAKTVIPARAVAKISMRLVPDMQPEEASQQFGAAVAAACPKGIVAQWKPIHAAPPSMTDPNNFFIQTCADAMTEIFGAKTVYVRSGGSIPIAGLFSEHLGIPSVLAGFGLPDDNLHAPNEKLYLPNFYRGIDAIVRYLEKLA